MKLTDGMIVTLENGDKVKVSLEKIEEPIAELVPGKKYELRHTRSFCHAFTNSGTISFSEIDGSEFRYVGSIGNGTRDIFYGLGKTAYVMFGNDNLNHVVREIKN